MLYKFLCSKKGFTLTEILVVFVIMAILTAIAVPIYFDVQTKQKIKDCTNQRIVASTAIEQVMYGMADNGKRQPQLYFANIPAERKESSYSADKIAGNGDDAYAGKPYLVLKPGDDAFTIGDIRGGYRTDATKGYSTGFAEGHYLKKKSLENTIFYKYMLANGEVPVCPFSEEGEPIYYVLFEDGTLMCPNEKCH